MCTGINRCSLQRTLKLISQHALNLTLFDVSIRDSHHMIVCFSPVVLAQVLTAGVPAGDRLIMQPYSQVASGFRYVFKGSVAPWRADHILAER